MMRAIVGVLLLLVVLFVGSYLYSNAKLSPQSNSSVTPSVTSQVLYPKTGDQLVSGQQYELRWSGGTGMTQIFLSDTALQSEGESVSLIDRVYNVPNTGSYNYTVPANVPEGKYVFQIGNLTSGVFEVVKTTSNQNSYCKVSDIAGNLSLEPAAGNIYGSITLKNTSGKTCNIMGSNFVEPLYTAQNITIIQQGQAGNSSIPVAPNQTLYSRIHYPNGPQCSGPVTTGQISFTYKISPTDSYIFKNQTGGTQQSISLCQSISEQTEVEVQSLSEQPLNQ